MRIAIACSGLGHVLRGIETWALDLAEALNGRGVDVVLYRGAGNGGKSYERTLNCLSRFSMAGRIADVVGPKTGGWRWGFGSGYQLEQADFAGALVGALRDNHVDIVHTQDAWVAKVLRDAELRGKYRGKVLFANGTFEDAEFLRQFDFVQHLAAWHAGQYEVSAGQGSTKFVAPNFVDGRLFSPMEGRLPLRSCNLPTDAFVIGCVSAVNRTKRVDYLLAEFALLVASNADIDFRKPYLLLAGSHDKETDQILAGLPDAARSRTVVLHDVPHKDMPDIYRAMDVFVMCTFKESLGIAFLEAMACGVPCIGHRFEVIEWVIGQSDSEDLCGGACIDMNKAGSLMRTLTELKPPWLSARGKAGRRRIEQLFEKDVVIGQIVNMYRKIIGVR